MGVAVGEVWRGKSEERDAFVVDGSDEDREREG